jgi:L-seryl-tRNA(Ser) seleniumtransferase
MRYEDLGVRPLINAADTITIYGGSRMTQPVIEAMIEAAGCFVDLNELNEKAGRRLAELTRNEAACITSGAACGLMLAASACMSGSDPEHIARLPDSTGMKNEIIVQRCQRISWDRCVRQSGARLVEIGQISQTTRQDLEQGINAQTAAILYYASNLYEAHALPLETVAEVAARHKVPVIVDAAANLPPVENLWRYTQRGADLVIFSGGKGLCGPQSTGLILGRRDLVQACQLNASPFSAIGRVAKVGKEEIMGLLTAVEQFVALDHAAVLREREDWVASLIRRLQDLPGLDVSRVYPGPHGQSFPRLQIKLASRERRDELVRQLKGEDPAIVVRVLESEAQSLFINPLTLNASEVEIIAERLLRICGVPTPKERGGQ